MWLYAKSQHDEAHFDPETGEAVVKKHLKGRCFNCISIGSIKIPF